jgi:hypothetical protein
MNIDDLVKKSFGQGGSIFKSTSGAITPPLNKVFVAILFLKATTLDSSGGLVADTNHYSAEFPGTEAAAHNAVSATTTSGTGGDTIDVNDEFDPGVIFGRWTEIDMASGMLFAFIGE